MMKNIIKSNLLALGFEEEYVSAEENGSEHGFYYYTFNIDDKCLLISDANDECNGFHTIQFFDFYDAIQIQNMEDLSKLVEVIKSNIINNKND